MYKNNIKIGNLIELTQNINLILIGKQFFIGEKFFVVKKFGDLIDIANCKGEKIYDVNINKVKKVKI